MMRRRRGHAHDSGGGVLAARRAEIPVVWASAADASRPGDAIRAALSALLPHPPIPEQPADEGREAAQPHHGHGADAFSENADEADDKDDDGADVLDDDGGIGNQRPEIIWLETRVALEVLEEGRLVGVVVWVCRYRQLVRIVRVQGTCKVTVRGEES